MNLLRATSEPFYEFEDCVFQRMRLSNRFETGDLADQQFKSHESPDVCVYNKKKKHASERLPVLAANPDSKR